MVRRWVKLNYISCGWLEFLNAKNASRMYLVTSVDPFCTLKAVLLNAVLLNCLNKNYVSRLQEAAVCSMLY